MLEKYIGRDFQFNTNSTVEKEFFAVMQMTKIYLASTSPRRISLLKNLGLKFEVLQPLWETRVYSEKPEEIAMLTALEKARSVQGNVEEGIIIAADTIVVTEDNEVLYKPEDEEEAYLQLRKLSSKTHRVITGLAIKIVETLEEFMDFEVTKVKFKELTDDEIWCYIKTGEPLDKAGSYGIQGYASIFIERIEGDYYNVVGLPLHKLYMMLSKIVENPIKFFMNCQK